MKTTRQIREEFLSYFSSKGHKVIPSSSLIPHNDPTLLFANSGMVQFKNYFTGIEKPEFKTATTAQKCVRAGGKHNDLENVGYTARHHTFFEMLGNFSFGDYFKEEAISYAWELVTKVYGLAKERLLVTVHTSDEEAASLWRKIADLPDHKIIRIPTSDNFWSMGDTGPCGPCTEIFYDHGEHIPGGIPGSENQDGDRFIEIWNLVFMQFEQINAETRITLPKPSIDTGMGLERVSAILQGKHDNYDVDLLRSIILNSADLSKTEADGPHKISHRVIADHLRSSAFLIADGILPSNEGRGYVLRRIMRRGMRHAHLLGCQEPHLYKLVGNLINQMGEQYPELERAQKLIEETLELEENRFKRTLSRGLKLLDEETDKLGTSTVLSGQVAFKLYDTYGFPVDLTQDILRGQNKTLDMEEFNLAMDRQREEARQSWSGSGEAKTDEHWYKVLEQYKATEFLGYKTTSAEAAILCLFADGNPINEATPETGMVELLANQTPFYAESGGQVGDIGAIYGSDQAEIEVIDTKKVLGSLHVHICHVKKGSFSKGDFIELKVNKEVRAKIAANHSCTHLFHAALRNRLGESVTQKGSLVNADKLRFDVSLSEPASSDVLHQIERDVNAMIIKNADVQTRFMPTQKAIEAGAMALFGEKYGDEVRVVTMGQTTEQQKPFSVELCGGTHVAKTGDIGFFKIIGQSSVSAGIRRFEALTGLKAVEYTIDYEMILNAAAQELKTTIKDIPEKVKSLQESKKALEKETQTLRRQISVSGSPDASNNTSAHEDVSGINFIGKMLKDIPARDLKPMVDDLKRTLKSGIATLISVDEDQKASIVIGVTDDLTNRFSAIDLVNLASQTLGGKGGGGRPDMAQAGGPLGQKASDAIETIKNRIKTAA